MFNRKISFLLVLSFCFLLGMATKAEVENLERDKEAVTDSTTTVSDKGYRIEVGKVKLRGEERKEIRFISPDGNVVKTLEKYWYKENVSKTKGKWITEINHVAGVAEKKNAVLLWECKYSTNYDPRGKEGPYGLKKDYKVKVLNSRGEESLFESFTAYPTGALAIPFWSTGISRDGSTIYVYYRDSSDVFHVEIYDTMGKKLASATYPHEFKADMQISPDGKIFGAETFKKGEGKHLFFLNVETGETKLVKAEGDKDGGKWNVIIARLADNKRIVLWDNEGIRGSVTINFDELTDDITSRFNTK